MNKLSTLQIVAWIGLVIMVLASIGEESFEPYFFQGLFLGVVLLHSYGKMKARTGIIVGSVIIFLVRMFGYTGSYDLIDMALWGSIIYLVW